MDLQQAKILLKKINTLNDSLTLDNGPIASIERDLMLSYIRQLYEAYLENSSNGQPIAKKPAAPKPQTSSSAPELEITPPPEEKPAPPEPPKRKYTPPKIIEIPDPAPEPVKTVNPPPPPNPTPPAPAPKPAPSFKGSSDPNIKALFDQKEAKELSEKLSLQPLQDLTKGLSINDRLLYTNDLFNKDSSLFNSTLKKLNEMDNMEQARLYLEEQAANYDWTDGEKADIARDFIKHVRRRFI